MGIQWVFQWNVSRRASMISRMELPKNRLTNITVMNTVTRGVFKAYAFFLNIFACLGSITYSHEDMR